MNLKEYHTLFTLICIGLLSLTTFAVFASMYPYPKTAERFFVLSLLGSEKTADKYYPEDDANVELKEEIHWYISIYNFMHEVQCVLIRIKINNSTLPHPDTVQCIPSPQEYEVMNITCVIAKEKSATIPFFWHLLEYSLDGDVLRISRLMINNITVNVDVSVIKGVNFRIIFELWHYDASSNEFKFAWDSNFGQRCAWNQMVFNVANNNFEP